MTETLTGTNRSAGVTYTELLDQDSHPVRDILRLDAPMEPGPTKVPVERYYSKAFHDLEVEKVWKRVWQMACHQDDIPEVGDHHVYDIAHLSFLIVRTGEDEFKAFWNACLHRGRQLKENHGTRARALRCPFHGWAWNIDGSVLDIPCQWDFPTLDLDELRLPEVQLGRWGGYPVLAANYLFEPGEPLGEYAKPFEIVNADGMKIGIIGIANFSSISSVTDIGNSIHVVPLEIRDTV